MKIPRSVVVNGERWRVVRKPLAKRGLDGLCFPPPRREIQIERKLPEGLRTETFLHELMHACLTTRKNSPVEERMISQLAPRLLAALRSAGWIR